jgi:hypothetical protein
LAFGDFQESSMSNVVQLFRREKAVSPSQPDTIVTFAVNDILASHAELVLTIKALSKHLDALEYFTDSLSRNSDARAWLKQETKRSRESLTKAVLDLSR